MKPPVEAPTSAQMRTLVVNWYRHAARDYVGGRILHFSPLVGRAPRRVSIRGQKTRWGSCSSAGTISLNLSLMFQRPEVVRYLMIHELCHRRHMNHSQRYWALVESFEPHWRSLDKELLQGWRHVPAWVFP